MSWRPSRGAASLLLVVGFAAIVLNLWRRAPRDVEMYFRWGQSRRGLRSATVEYRRDGERVRQATFHYGDAAPYEQHHRVRLTRGDYTALVTLGFDAAPRTFRVSFTFAGEDQITLAGPW